MAVVIDKIHGLMMHNHGADPAPPPPVDPDPVSPLDPNSWGYYYNYAAVVDPRNIAAAGWKVPSGADFNTLETFLGGQMLAGAKMKKDGDTWWNMPNLATNSSGFSAIGGGGVGNSGGFQNFKTLAIFYCSDPLDQFGQTTTRALLNDAAYLAHGNDNPHHGFSVRLVKESTDLNDGEEGVYIGNDGTTYKTICIGSQEFMAENLHESAFRNNDSIYIANSEEQFFTADESMLIQIDKGDDF